MQRIRTVRYPRRNIGGDRAYAKLFYTRGFRLSVGGNTNYSVFQNLAYNVGASVPGSALHAVSLTGILGVPPGLAMMAANFMYYRVRGIKLKFTIWPDTSYARPACFFVNAGTSSRANDPANGTPYPNFPDALQDALGEQRWAKWSVIRVPNAGARPTTVSVYYSVNRVYGPDAVARNDMEFTGAMSPSPPFFSASGYPTRSPWLQFGVMPMVNGDFLQENVAYALQIQATVYTQFFGRRPQAT